MTRILGIDFGEKRIGLALSDPLGITAQTLPTLMRTSIKQVLAILKEICQENAVQEIVIGLPINMNGTLGPKAKEVLSFVSDWEKLSAIPMKTWDERLSSRQAGRLMIEEGLSRKKQRETSDKLASMLILQGYLESKRIREDR